MAAITFAPLYMERVWGGRELERVYGRKLPDPEKPYGESWEIVDRPDAQSIVSAGPFAGATLHELWTTHREEIFGKHLPDHPRFPILIKVLDARDDLSIQVHPPAEIAERLGGEPKSEMWYIADCDEDAKLYVGLKRGVTRAAFEASIAKGTVADQVHALSPSPGESIFLASGRLHAIGAGFLIHEIQQNSDTTYRVFDWNRLGLDAKPRQLHVEESLASIDFDDVEPAMDLGRDGHIASSPYFVVDRIGLTDGDSIGGDEDRFAIYSVIEGCIQGDDGSIHAKGDTLLQPRQSAPLKAVGTTGLLKITLPV